MRFQKIDEPEVIFFVPSGKCCPPRFAPYGGKNLNAMSESELADIGLRVYTVEPTQEQIDARNAVLAQEEAEQTVIAQAKAAYNLFNNGTATNAQVQKAIAILIRRSFGE